MTLLLSWIGIDSRSPSSIYLASDSRINWQGKVNFDYARKVFGCKEFPEIFGYCGDVLFPSIVLSQIVELIDKGFLIQKDWSYEEKSHAIFTKIIQSFNEYPSEILTSPIQILHCSRDNERNFYCNKIEWELATKKWRGEIKKISKYSDKLFVLGSGGKEFLNRYDLYQSSEENFLNWRTSRTVFHCFCDTLSNIKDVNCGGPPQLTGLYRINNSQIYGIIQNSKRYFQGIDISNLTNFDNIEWRNENFEICDGNTLQRKVSAQKQPNPLMR